MAARIKKGDKVVVIAGRSKGETGNVLKVEKGANRLIVEGVNRVRKHSKPTPKTPEGGILEQDAPIHVSNVMLIDADSDSRTRVRAGTDKAGKKVRIAVKSGKVLDG